MVWLPEELAQAHAVPALRSRHAGASFCLSQQWQPREGYSQVLLLPEGPWSCRLGSCLRWAEERYP